jgi:hypothetical protein
MPTEIRLDKLPCGVSAESTFGPGEITVRTREFVTSQDGSLLTDRLEGFPDEALNKLPNGWTIPRAIIDHLLIIVRRDRTAIVYLNELDLRTSVRTKRALKAGEPIGRDDIADIVKLDLGVRVAPDTGVVLVLSAGWRKALFYDFGPLHPDNQIERTFDLELLAAQMYSELLFQELHRISDVAWDRLFEQRWFPFRSLTTDLIRQLISHATEGWPITSLMPKVVEETRARCDGLVIAIAANSMLANHHLVLKNAIGRYLERDFVSCVSILFTRIEGILRELCTVAAPDRPTTQANLASVVAQSANESSPLLPHRFEDYLRRVYFASFDPGATSKFASRNSVGHGIAAADAFSEEAATIGVLILEHLLYHLPVERKNQ